MEMSLFTFYKISKQPFDDRWKINTLNCKCLLNFNIILFFFFFPFF